MSQDRPGDPVSQDRSRGPVNQDRTGDPVNQHRSRGPVNQDGTGGPVNRDRIGGPRVPGSQWYDGEAGPLVRPYAMTGGRTRPGPTGVRLDLIDQVALDPGAPRFGNDAGLGPEHWALIELCRAQTQSVAELGAGADLPVGVVRVLLGDLLELGCVTVSRPMPPGQHTDAHILREVIEGLRAL